MQWKDKHEPAGEEIAEKGQYWECRDDQITYVAANGGESMDEAIADFCHGYCGDGRQKLVMIAPDGSSEAFWLCANENGGRRLTADDLTFEDL